MKFNWFHRNGIFYRPISVPGWIVFIAAVIYLVYSFIEIDSRSHSVSDTLMNWAFNCIIVAVMYSLIGFFTNRPERRD